MNIYAVADLHGRRERLDRIGSHAARLRPDVVVIAGDITGQGDHDALLHRLNDLPAPLLTVRGNMDSREMETLLDRYANILSLDRGEATIQGVHFVGLGGVFGRGAASKKRIT